LFVWWRVEATFPRVAILERPRPRLTPSFPTSPSQTAKEKVRALSHEKIGGKSSPGCDALLQQPALKLSLRGREVLIFRIESRLLVLTSASPEKSSRAVRAVHVALTVVQEPVLRYPQTHDVIQEQEPVLF
jgi:hypothetical protein